MNRRTFLTTTGAFLTSKTLYGAAAKNETFVYVGSTAKGEGEGIHVGKWDPSTGTVSDMKLAFQAIQPSFLVSGQKKGKKFIFAGHQPQPTMAALSSFEIDSSGSLKVVNTIDLEDLEESLIQIVLDKRCDCLVSASYRSSKVFSFTVAADGKLSGPVSSFQLSGSGPNLRRQTTAHAHGAVISPDNRFALINDLGTDKIMVYKLAATSAVLMPNTPPFFTAKSGSGPRHLAFHPSGKWAYCISELDSTLNVLNWDAKTGKLMFVESVPTLEPNADITKNRAGEVIIDKFGRFLYACNRGPAEELLAYSIESNGRLKFIARTPLGGKEARHFALSPDGRHLVVAEQFTNFVTVFGRDLRTGELKATGNKYPVNRPSCVVFA
jgi:6-phosphogluconolactonase